jgi:drug/metabolite transporter (DMT)-like permease
MPRRFSPSPAQITLLLVAAQMAVGSAALFARFGLTDLSPLTLSAWRLALATIVVIIVASRTEKVPLLPHERLRLIIAGICLGTHFATWFASLQTLPVGRSTLLVSTAPLWTGLASMVLFRERLSRKFWGGLALAGVGLVAFVGREGMTQIQTGDLLATIGAVAIAAYFLLVKPVQARVGTMVSVVWTYASATVALWIAVLLFHESPLPPQAHALRVWAVIVALAVIPQLLGHTTMNLALRYVSPAIIAASTLLEPVIAALLAWLFLHETLTPTQMIGGVVVLLGMGLTLTSSTSLASSDTSQRDTLDEVALSKEEEGHDR